MGLGFNSSSNYVYGCVNAALPLQVKMITNSKQNAPGYEFRLHDSFGDFKADRIAIATSLQRKVNTATLLSTVLFKTVINYLQSGVLTMISVRPPHKIDRYTGALPKEVSKA